MNADIRIFQVDAFTQRPFSGNPAGVVLGADSLSTQQMQQLARELNNGDTVFALQADGADHDLRARFFTPRTEAGFVGHATLALHAVLTQLEGARARTQKHRNGSATVTLVPGSTPAQFAIRQPPPLLGGAPDAAVLAPVLQALGLQHGQLDARCPPQFAGANNARLLLGIGSSASLAALQPDLARLAQLSAAGAAAGYFVFTLAPRTQSDVESRMFCPALGINEDPVSGNAHGMLASYLFTRGLLPGLALRGAQGHHMDRGGEVEIALTVRDGVLESLEIRGNALVLFEARMNAGVLG